MTDKELEIARTYRLGFLAAVKGYSQTPNDNEHWLAGWRAGNNALRDGLVRHLRGMAITPDCVSYNRENNCFDFDLGK